MMWGHTTREMILSEKIEGDLHKTLCKWGYFRKFRNWMQKSLLKKKCHFFKSARTQLHCALWCYKTPAADFYDWQWAVYLGICLFLHFAVLYLSKKMTFFRIWKKIRKSWKIKKGREAIKNTCLKGCTLWISYDLNNTVRKVFRPYRWICTVL